MGEASLSCAAPFSMSAGMYLELSYEKALG